MRAFYAEYTRETAPHDAWRGWLDTALTARAPLIAGVAPGRPFTLTLDAPSALFPHETQWSGDSLWFAPNDDFFLAGAGDGLDVLDPRGWRAEQSRWVRLGRQSAPLAFLTAPPLGGEAQIRTPAVLLRRAGGDLSLQLSGRRDASSPALVAHGWRTNLASILSRPLRGVGGRIVERRFSPDRDAWTSRVLAATRAIKAGRFDKVVLARRLDVALDRAIDPLWLARALVRAAPEGRIFKLKLGAGALVAASPELLAVKRGMRVTSHALAGTAPYIGDAPADWRAEQNLFASPKERREHQLVVASIAEGMRGICDDVAHAPTPGLMRLRRLCHLWTPVTGRLRPGFDLFDLLAILHPTPAVLGFPRAAARAFLHEIEESRDSLYTGLAGWIDGDGDGDAAVVLRSAYLEGAQARLWAGAGIMAESDPEAEWAETELKMSGLLDLLEPPI